MQTLQNKLINYLNRYLPPFAGQLHQNMHIDQINPDEVQMSADLQRALEVSTMKDLEKLVNLINDIQMV